MVSNQGENGNFLKFLFTALAVFVLGCPEGACASSSLEFTVPLNKLAQAGTARLEGIHSGYTVKVPVPERWTIREAVLRFSYVNSSALLPQNSRLVVELEGHPLGQVALDPLSTVGRVELPLPPSLLEPGYNDLHFSVSQHYTLECEDPSAPELWTVLELDKASLDLRASLDPVPLELSRMGDFLFDPKLFPVGEAHVVVESLDADFLRLASLAASGVALRFDYRPVHFTLSQRLRPGVDNVVVGLKGFCEKISGSSGPSLSGASLGIAPLPAASVPEGRDPFHALVLVCGESLEDLRLASKTFAFLSFPFPDADSMEVRSLEMPETLPYAAPGTIAPGEKYTFEALGFSSATLRGMSPAPLRVDFRLPSDLLIKPNDYAHVSLHLAYGAGMRSDSVLNLFLNDRYVSSIPLDRSQGGTYEGYGIGIPTRLFRRGRNTFVLKAVLAPSSTGRCQFFQTENLVATLFRDSTLRFPPMDHWVDLPRLELLFEDGRPLASRPDGRDLLIYPTEKTEETAAAVLNLAGMISQKTGYPLFQADLSLEPPSKGTDKEILVVGPLSTVPAELVEEAPLRWGKEGVVPYPLPSTLLDKAEEGESGWTGWLERLRDRLLERFREKEPARPRALTATSRQNVELSPRRAMLMEFQSPFKTGRTVVLLGAQRSRGVFQGSLALWEPAVQSGCRGDLTLVDLTPPRYKTSSLELGPRYYVGEKTLFSGVNRYIFTYPWLFLLLLLLCFMIPAFGIYFSLKRRRRRKARDPKN